MSVARSSLKSFLNLISGAFNLNFLVKLTQQKVFSPFYHIVSDNPPVHVKHLYPVRSIDQFQDDLNFLQKHFEFIGLDKFIQYSKEAKLKNRFCFLSFDDGLSELYNIIAPILKKRNIPAHIFINSGFVDNHDLMFRYKVSLIIDSILTQDISKESMNDIFKLMNFTEGVDFKKYLLELKYNDISLIDRIAEILKIDFKAYLNTQKPYLTSEQIVELQQDGFTFGSHSIDHPEYRFIDYNEQIRQTSESMKFVQNNFKIINKTFAFPFTDYNVSLKFFNHIEDNKIVDFTFGGAGLKMEKIKFHFQRFPMEDYDLPAKKMIITEYLYYLIKMPFRKNTITR